MAGLTYCFGVCLAALVGVFIWGLSQWRAASRWKRAAEWDERRAKEMEKRVKECELVAQDFQGIASLRERECMTAQKANAKLLREHVELKETAQNLREELGSAREEAARLVREREHEIALRGPVEPSGLEILSHDLRNLFAYNGSAKGQKELNIHETE